MIRTVLLALLVVCGMPLASARMRTLLTKGNHATIHNEMNFPVGMSLGDDFDPKTQPPPVVVLPGQSHDWTTSSHSIGFNLYRMCPGKIDDESNTWQRLCELKQDNPNIGKQIVQDVPWPSAVVKTMDGDNPYLYTGAPYIYLQCRTKNGMFEQQSVLEGGGACQCCKRVVSKRITVTHQVKTSRTMRGIPRCTSIATRTRLTKNLKSICET